MGAIRDGLLALVALFVFGLLALLFETSLSKWAFAVGCGATLAFESLTIRYRTTVRTVWERPRVQATILTAGIGMGILGAFLAPRYVLAAGIGALGTYLFLLGVLTLVKRYQR
ncbi:hypothetical protein OB919_06585 [Halobacteria archaeon AArc-curdl1]|uniref:Uncharacterized protein n=1 Tax=Natronosalvus hydrolyticus TaxID=2979988 RepID=A0AAP3E6B4_9EURY|nr:hypothetical protein [Halobacteria archaeon AArc-curdl1]